MVECPILLERTTTATRINFTTDSWSADGAIT
jgi:hypothetical protein